MRPPQRRAYRSLDVLARGLLRWLEPRGIHYAWVVMGIAFLTMLVSSAALGLPGAFLKPISREFAWTTADISSALAVRFMLYGLMGPFAAVMLDRYGMRRVVCAALLLVAGGVIAVTRMTNLWQLVLSWGIVLGFGSGLTALVLGATVANRWFERRRGLVLGMLTASAATGQLIFLPLASFLIVHYGWRVAITPVFIACLSVAGLALLFLEDRPAVLGLAAYGADKHPTPSIGLAPSAAVAQRASFLEPLHVLCEASRARAFWVLFGTFFVCGLSTNGLIQTHFIALCGDYGLAAVPASSVLAMIGGFDFVGTIASGWLSDRFDNRKLLFWYYGMRGLSLLWLPHSDFTMYGLSLFAVFYGLDWIATVPPTVKLAAASFGKQQGAMIFGWVFAAHQLGGAVAAYGAGLSRTVLLTYAPALYAAGIACLLAACGIFLIRPPAARSRPAGPDPLTSS
jgi:MFS family permease